MIIFYSIVILITLSIGWILVGSITRQNIGDFFSNEKINLDTIKRQKAELDDDYRMGLLDLSQYDSAVADLEHRYLDEVDDTRKPGNRGFNGSSMPLAICVMFLPLTAIAFYVFFGNSEAIGIDKNPANQVSSITQEEFGTMTLKLSDHLENNPDDIEGWVMLGRAYYILGDFKNAVEAWKIPLAQDPGNINLQISVAEGLILANGGQFSDESMRLIESVLKLKPFHKKALSLAGGEKFASGEYLAAIVFWRKLLTVTQNETEYYQSINESIAEAKRRHQSQEITISITGTVKLSPGLRHKVSPDHTVFIVVRNVSDAKIPIIVDRVPVGSLPYNMRLDKTKLMREDIDFKTSSKFIITGFISDSDRVEGKLPDIGSDSIFTNIKANAVELILKEVKNEEENK